VTQGKRDQLQAAQPRQVVEEMFKNFLDHSEPSIKPFFRSYLGRHRRWQVGPFVLFFVSLIDVKVRRNKLRLLVVGAIVLLVWIPFLCF
jgi:hypothetical protein